MPLISYNVSVGINKKAKTSSKNKRSRHDTWNARHVCDSRSTNSAGKLTGSARDTVPNKTKQARGRTTANTILVDSTHTKTNVGCDVVLLSLSRKSSPTKRSEKNLDVDLDWDDAFKDAILPILRLHLMQTSKTGFKLKNLCARY
jgi:hypothetical protein